MASNEVNAGSQSYKIGQVGAPAKVPKETFIEYKGGVITSTGSRGGLIMTKENTVKLYQRFFQKANANMPVHLTGRKDELVYKGCMVASLVGLTFVGFAMYQLALPPRQQ